MNLDAFKGDEVKRFFRWGAWVLVILGVFLAFQALDAYKTWRGSGYGYNSISVAGEGEAFSMPDIASFSFGVTADAESVADAQGKVTEKMDAVLAELKVHGIEAKDIKTNDYSVWPKYRYEQAACTVAYCPPSRQIPDGYTVTHTVNVKVRQTDTVGTVLGAIGAKGATNISGVTFTADDPTAVLAEARSKAIENAKEKAEQLAKELDVKLVRIVSYYDNAPGYPVPMMYAEKTMSIGMGGDAAMPTLPQGENRFVSNVTITYEIR